MRACGSRKLCFPKSNNDEIYLPYAFGDLTYFSPAGSEVWVKAAGVESNNTRVLDLELYNASGDLVANVERFTLRSMPQSKLRQAVTPAISSNDALGQWIYDQKLEEVQVRLMMRRLHGAESGLFSSTKLA